MLVLFTAHGQWRRLGRLGVVERIHTLKAEATFLLVGLHHKGAVSADFKVATKALDAASRQEAKRTQAVGAVFRVGFEQGEHLQAWVELELKRWSAKGL